MGGLIIFEEKGRRTTKKYIIFSVENGVRNTVFKFVPQKTPYQPNESRKPDVGAYFPNISGSVSADCFQQQ